MIFTLRKINPYTKVQIGNLLGSARDAIGLHIVCELSYKCQLRSTPRF
jgi:hypothetical protein